MPPVNIPLYAKLVFGACWGGWAWLALSPNGQCHWWVCYFEQGEEGAKVRRFRGIQELEMFFDMVDLQITETY